MKIVFFATRFAFEYSIELANNVLKHKSVREVFLFLPKSALSDSQKKQISKEVNYIPFDLPGNKKVYASIRSMLSVINKIKSIQPNILHVQGSAHPYFWLFHYKINKIPVVDTVHDPKPHPGFGSVLQTFMRNKGVKTAKKWFIHGTILKKDFLELYKINPADVIVIPKGHYEIFKKYTNEILPENPLSIVFFGNITKYKGIHVLIEASKLVIERFPDVKFIIAGRTRKKDEDAIDLSYLNNDKNFVLKNYRLSDKEVADLYYEAGMIVLPYIEASQSGVLSIAFGFGKAVIATRVGGLPEIIEDNKTGLLIDPNNIEDLAEAFCKLLGDNEKRIMLGKNAYEYAKKELSWEIVAKMTVEVYKQIV